MRLAIASDTHGRENRIAVPGGDIFFYAGDFCKAGGGSGASALARADGRRYGVAAAAWPTKPPPSLFSYSVKGGLTRLHWIKHNI